MAINFSSSLAAIQADLHQRLLWILLIPAVLLVLWLGWLFMVPLDITKQGKGTLQNGQPDIAITAGVNGRIGAIHLNTGERVNAGDVLIHLQADEERQLQSVQQALTEQEAALAAQTLAVQGQLEQLRIQLSAQVSALASLREQLVSVKSRHQQQQALVELLARAGGAVSKIELQREQLQQQSLYEQLLVSQQQVSAAEQALKQAQEQEKIARANFAQAQAEQQRSISGLQLQQAQLTEALDHKMLRAPKSARVAEVMPLQPGQWVAAGTQLATLVPDGDLQVVANFDPADAQGYIRNGQTARIQMDSFPWLQYGAVSARVVQVDEADRDGRMRVVLALEPKNSLALRTGMTGQVIVDVASATPWQLLLQSLGRQQF
jgi:multidrug resistance efflux pump